MLKQILSITMLGLRSIPERLGPSLVIVVGLAGVVAVFTALLAMAAGFQSTLESAGRPDVALVLRGGSQAELNSGISPRTGHDHQAGTRRRPGRGRPAACLGGSHRHRRTDEGRREDRLQHHRARRRAAPPSPCDRSCRIVEGRSFAPGPARADRRPGRRSPVRGRAHSARSLRMRGSDWTVVGVFESGDAYESELWADVEVAQSTFNRQGYSCGTAAAGRRRRPADHQGRPVGRSSRQRRRGNGTAVLQRPDQSSSGRRSASSPASSRSSWHSARCSPHSTRCTPRSGARAREIATLRAIGFRGAAGRGLDHARVADPRPGRRAARARLRPTCCSTTWSVSTLGANFTQVVFRFTVTPTLVVDGLVIAS